LFERLSFIDRRLKRSNKSFLFLEKVMTPYHVAFSVHERGVPGCKILATIVDLDEPVTPIVVRDRMPEVIRADWPTETKGKEIVIVSWQKFD